MADKQVARQLSGRRPIYTEEREITPANVCAVLSKALAVHTMNRADIKYLWDYFRNLTPIRFKEKEVRESINHRVAQPLAYQITEFKNSVCFGEPVRYISRGDGDELLDRIDELNDYMIATRKEAADRDLGHWIHIAGIGYRMALPSKTWPNDVAPFRHYVLDPQLNFIVRRADYTQEPVMSVTIIPRESGSDLHCIYTPNAYYEIEGESNIVKQEPNPLGMIPVVAYPLNQAMLGCFENVTTLIDAINELESNRLDDVQQYVNSFLALLGGSMDADTYKNLDEYKMLCLPEGVDAKYLSVALGQGDMQTLKDNLYQAVLTSCGMPSQSTESTSTSDTGAAVLYRGGWSQAQSRAADTEIEFKRSEMDFLALVLRIMDSPLKVHEVDVKFTRRFVEDLPTKVTSLQGLLNAGVHPEVAIATSGIWNDPTDVYIRSKEYLAQWDVTDDEDVRESGQNDPNADAADEEAVRTEP